MVWIQRQWKGYSDVKLPSIDGRNGSRDLAPGPPVVEGGKTCSSAVAKGAKTADVPHLVDDSTIITDHF
jgi:hypothetical protein